MDLVNRVAIVTGASRGIGHQISIALAHRGAKVALVARKIEALKIVEDEIRSKGNEAASFPCDITIAPDVNAMVEKVHKLYGKIDILVNSAFWGPPASIEDTTEEFWDHTLDTTLKAPYLCARAVIPLFKENKGGRIVNIGSRSGKDGENNRTAYCAAKFGLAGLTAALAVELTPFNIHVHLITPDATHTPWWYEAGANMTKKTIARMIPPEVIAEVVCLVINQPDQVHIPDVPVYNYLDPFEGNDSPVK
jgi:NAD(P)-dependent dehydrogenase (short-subunit alcohol dehydrogenase family)